MKAQMKPNLSTNICACLCLLNVFFIEAQPVRTTKKASSRIDIPMEPAYWMHDSTTTEFITHRSVKAVRGKKGAGYQVFLKNQPFVNGTIEFDVELIGIGFPGINFRMSPDKKNGENFYIRSFGKVTPETRTTLQYAPIVNSISMWDLYDEYQTGANIYQQGWNHVKLVVSGRQMTVYVNDMKNAALHVACLDALTNSGDISLSGNVIYANLSIDPSQTDGLSPEAGYNPVAADTRFLRQWRVSEPINFPFGKEPVFPLPSMYGTLTKSDIPDSTSRWKNIQADRRAVVNLSTYHGGVENDVRRLSWLKTTVYSDHAQSKLLNLGFSDEIWLLINGEIVFVGKNYFGTPNARQDGRCTIENAAVTVPLKQGKNEITVGLANYFYGWGLIARFNNTDGIQLGKQ